jgi:DNA (cytosine-5)-methyltransferase 1
VKTWPTPSSRDWKDTPGMAQDAYDKHGKFRNRIDQLARMTYAIERASSPPTPDSGASGSLNPTFVEWLMGYPLGWTALKAWGTRSSRKSPSGSAGRSSPPKD